MTPVPGGLDWATQPDPFRRFASAPQVDLPLLAGELPARWDDLFRPHGVPARAFDLDTLATLLELSLGLSDWKSHAGSRWALRWNPSSGNLHPTEGYLISPALPGLAPTPRVYHYQPEQRRLEQRAEAPLSWFGGSPCLTKQGAPRVASSMGAWTELLCGENKAKATREGRLFTGR